MYIFAYIYNGHYIYPCRFFLFAQFMRNGSHLSLTEFWMQILVNWNKTFFPHLKPTQVTVNPCHVNFLLESRFSRPGLCGTTARNISEMSGRTIIFFICCVYNKTHTHTHNDTLSSWQILSESFARKWFRC